MNYLWNNQGKANNMQQVLKYIMNDINNSDIKREYILKRKGWKLVKIISIKDKLLSDKQFIDLISEAKQYLLDTKYTWVEINIDINEYKCSQYIKKII